MFEYTVSTKKSVDKIIEDLSLALKDVQFGILWKFDLHKKLEDKGFITKNKYTILEVCNPDEASGILTENPLVSYFLPCKIVITVDKQETRVGFTRPTALMGLIGDENILEKAKEVEDTLIRVMEQIK